ncbi:MAG TPA: NAD(P)H-quinone oxidoreductase [Terriglobales bacterium]|nr:NAD(P)H-quinone oxidoreductase [Terriglobales bacterium]
MVITQPGDSGVLRLQEVPVPKAGDREVLIKVMASALNRADLMQRAGKYPAPKEAPQDVPGIEFAGEVVAMGDQSSRWQVGQRVFGITGGGAHAEFIAVHQDTVAEVPANLSWAQAAAVPEVFITAHDAVWVQAGLASGESLLIHAVGSGVGLAAVQLARAKRAVPFGTSRTKDKLDRARTHGMEDGVVIRDDLNVIREFSQNATSGKGFDVVLDLAGGGYVTASIPAMANKGRIMLVGLVAGSQATVNLGQMLSRRIRMTGTVMRARSLDEKIKATERFAQEVVPLLAQERLYPEIDCEFPIDEIQSAHQRLESNDTFGKVVLRIGY